MHQMKVELYCEPEIWSYHGMPWKTHKPVTKNSIFLQRKIVGLIYDVC